VSPTPPTPPTPIEGWEVLDLLTSLVQKSLVLYEEDEQGQGRYRLLETVRQYARDRLVESGQEAAQRGRHGDWFLTLAEEAEPRLKGAEQDRWLERLEREHDNLRAALAWSQAPAPWLGSGTRGAPSAGTEGVDNGGETSLRMAGAMSWFWFLRSYLSEGRRWLAGALAQAEEAALRSGGAGRTAARARALYGAGMLAWDNGDMEAARLLLEESAAIGRELGNKRAIAYPLGWVGMVLQNQGDGTGARSVAAESVQLFREVGDRWGLALSLTVRGYILLKDNETVARSLLEESTMLLEESTALFRVLGDKWGLALAVGGLGLKADRQGDIRMARSLLEEALALRREVGHKYSIAMTLHALGGLARREGDYGRAAALLEEALAIQREIGNKNHAAACSTILGHVAREQGNDEAARAHYDESLAILRELDEGGNTCMRQGHLLLELGDVAAARSRYEEWLALERATENAQAVAWALLEVGHAAWLQGEPEVTQSHAREALGLFQEREGKEDVLAALESLAVAAFAQGRKAGAARLFGAVEAQREARELSGPGWWRRPRERVGEAVRAAALGQEFAAAWAEGRAMSLEAAVAFALSEEETSSPDGA
jgi:tetratricopeptide (TPR) repeat protein